MAQEPQGPSFLTHVRVMPGDGIRRTGRAKIKVRLTRDEVTAHRPDVLALQGVPPILASNPFYGKGCSRNLGRTVRTSR